MAAPHSMNLSELVSAQLEQADPDALRSLLKTFCEALMSAEAQALCGAGYGEVSTERTNSRNGYRSRDWDTRAGSIELRVPKLRQGSYFPEWLLGRRRRSEQALISVIATSYLLGVSTRRVERLCCAMGIDAISKSQVSEMAKALDEAVEVFRNRPLDQGPYRFLWADALVCRVREEGAIRKLHVLIATGVNASGYREILGMEICSEESGAGWLSFFRSLVARGLSGVCLVTSDAHRGLVEAIGATLPGASWQRCRTHYLRDLLAKVPKSTQPWVATLVRTIFDQPDDTEVHAQFARVVDALEGKLPEAASHLDEARDDLLAFTAYPREIWRQIWSNNPQERLNREIRRRTDVVGTFPDRSSAIRLIGALLAEQHEEWAEQRRYMGQELLFRVAGRKAGQDENEGVMLPMAAVA
ncbi:MAG TPA: IS256 family transposase [Solirubrobacteraceae bacterium]|nr:IS256 family transposase [Solirubrobacteraceae bacterium]